MEGRVDKIFIAVEIEEKAYQVLIKKEYAQAIANILPAFCIGDGASLVVKPAEIEFED